MNSGHLSSAICIPTFRRPHLLRQLVGDLRLQAVDGIDRLIIVDGDPASGDVLSMLTTLDYPEAWNVVYIPSNHGNAAYQRYLGARVASEDIVVFSDDDIRFTTPDTLQKLLLPFTWRERFVVGVSPRIEFPRRTEAPKTSLGKMLDALVKGMGGSRKAAPGTLSAVGDRIPYSVFEPDYARVHWLHGGVMAFRRTSVLNMGFSDDLFALAEVRCALCDDTYISHQTGALGELLIAHCTSVDHPNADISRIFPSQSHKRAYAVAYSRRFLNDHYRVAEAPRITDRWLLVRSYVGNSLINWARAVASPQLRHFAYAWGYTLGAARGLVLRPIAQNLAPSINWQADAQAALAEAKIVKASSDA